MKDCKPSEAQTVISLESLPVLQPGVLIAASHHDALNADRAAATAS